MLEVFAYNAGKGDCIRIRFANSHNIFVDSGVIRFATKFREICEEIIKSGETLDALILTHADDDHIGGFLGSLRFSWYKCPFKEVWMNCSGSYFNGDRTLSTRQNDEVYSTLLKQNIKVFPMLKGDRKMIAGAVIEVYWPEEIQRDNPLQGCNDIPLARHSDYQISLTELADMKLPQHDTSLSNKNSIVFSIKFEGHSILFLGDAWAEDAVKLHGTYDLVKLSHHGSSKNISEDFPRYIHATNFLICTDGIAHPDKQTIAKLEKWYGDISIYSPSVWWENGYFAKDDREHKISYYYKDGLTIAW